MTGLRLAFRCDASVAIGTGHVMRCLTLARALQDNGHMCHFVMRDLPGNMGARVAAEGFAVSMLPAPDRDYVPGQGAPFHAAWAGVSAEEDATQTAVVLAPLGFDWLVMDHYAFDAGWQRLARPKGARLLVLDDLADRPHVADVLLDQNLGRAFADYAGLVGPDCRRLIGPQFALLRPEFARVRADTLAGRQHRQIKHILIAMGGVDAPDVTGYLLSDLPMEYQITVVMGSAAPALARVQSLAAARGARVFVDTPDMAALMAEADLAIGGVGGSAWERCTLGLPTLMVIMAENQVAAAEALAATGAARLVGLAGDDGLGQAVRAALTDLRDEKVLADMALSTAQVCDGGGVPRLIEALMAPVANLRPATPADAETVWRMRRAVDNTHAFKSGGAGALSDHLRWFDAALSDPARALLMAEIDGQVIGHVRLDEDMPASRVISIVMAPECQGRGWGKLVLAAVISRMIGQRVRLLKATVHRDNQASLHLFSSASFTLAARDGDYRGLALAL